MYLDYNINFKKNKKKYLDKTFAKCYIGGILIRHKRKEKNMNSRLLKGMIKMYDGSQSVLAEAMGLSLSRLNAKINETGAQFNQTEIALIRERYKLTEQQVTDIFFAN